MCVFFFCFFLKASLKALSLKKYAAQLQFILHVTFISQVTLRAQGRKLRKLQYQTGFFFFFLINDMSSFAPIMTAGSHLMISS